MDEQQILAHAETRANEAVEEPTEEDLAEAEAWVRQATTEGATYDPEQGWVWPEPPEGTAWFINEEGEVYGHDAATQEEEFPNDDHTSYATQEEAQAAADALDDGFVDPTTIPLSRCHVSFLTDVTLDDTGTLAEAAEIAALNLMRFGLDDYYVLYVDPETDRRWIAQYGNFRELAGGGD